jgi:glycosyltransferase involved in cell wall biosynthesis
MKAGRYDIVTCDTKKGGLLTCWAARLAGVPFALYIVRGLTSDKGGRARRLVFFNVERAICRGASRVLFMSESNLKICQEKRICAREKMVVFGGGSPNGIDTTHFRRSEALQRESVRFRERLGIPLAAFVFGYVGRLVREKGVPELADAWVAISAKYPGAHLLLIAPPEVGPRLEGQMELLRKSPNVHFAGFMEDPVVGYAAMDCLVMPSLGEGLPLVILEAGAMELPVIATRAPGCVDAMVHEKTGLLITPRDSVDLVTAMERVLMAPDGGREWGRNGRRRCEELFAQELIWQGYADLYERVLAG